MTSSKPSRQRLRPLRCTCWNEGCHNFISPYLKVRLGAVYCSSACREVGSRLAWLFQACPTCGSKLKKEGGRCLCEHCQGKLNEGREARRAARKQRNLLAPLPEKQCAWRYCQAPFIPEVGSQKYCGRQCMLNSNAGGGKYGEIPSPTPTQHQNRLCAGGCGGWVSYYPFQGGKRCYQCFLGQKYGKLNHLPQPSPPVVPPPGTKRPSGTDPLKDISKELLPWLAGLTLGIGALALLWHLRPLTRQAPRT